MAAKRQSTPIDRLDRDKILERIERRYAELDEKLKELEARLPELGGNEAEEPTAPRKPR